MSANIPNDPVAIQRFFTSRDNNANASTYVGQEQRLWYDPVTNAIYVSDGNTAGGIMVGTSSSGNGTPGGPTNSIQYNAGSGTFGGTSNVVISGNGISVVGNVSSAYFVGNGSQLTGLPVTYSNANVAAYLPTYTGNLAGGNISITGNVDLGNLYIIDQTIGGKNLNANINITPEGDGWLTLPRVGIDTLTIANTTGKMEFITPAGVDLQFTPGSLGNILTAGNIIPTGNNLASVGDIDHRYTGLWLGAGNINIIDQTLSQNQQIYADNGNLIVANASGLSFGNFRFYGNTMALANAAANIIVGTANATGWVQFNRSIAVSTTAGETAFSVGKNGLTNIYTPSVISNTQSALNIIGSSSGNSYPRPSTFTGTMLQITGQDNTPARVSIDAYGANGAQNSYTSIAARVARGTVDAPQPLQANDLMMRITNQGWADGAFAPGIARLDFSAAEAFTSNAAVGTYANIQLVTVGSNTIHSAAQFWGNGLVFANTATGGAANLGIQFQDGTFQNTAFSSANVVTGLTAATGISLNPNAGPNATGNVTITNLGVITVAGTADQVFVGGANVVAPANGAVQLSLPQNIAPTSNVQFYSLTVNDLSIIGNVSNVIPSIIDGPIIYVANTAADFAGIDNSGLITGNAANGAWAGMLYDTSGAYANTWNFSIGNSIGIYAGNVYGVEAQFDDKMHVGFANATIDFPDASLQADCDTDSYNQIVIMNHNQGGNASGDFVAVANNGDDGNFYIDMGMNSNVYNNNDYLVTKPNDGYLYVNGGNLVIGTQTPSKTINFFTGGTDSATAYNRANITDTGLTVVGNVSANNFIGNSLATTDGISATGNITGSYIFALNQVSVAGAVTGQNIYTVGVVSATANVIAGNVRTTGTISAAGNIYGANLITATTSIDGGVSTSGNVTANNISVVSLSASGNITGANVIATNLLRADTITVVGNIIGGNLLTNGYISTTGNATFGNVTSAGRAILTGNVDAGNLRTIGGISATGNIGTAGFFIGDGGFISNLTPGTKIVNGTSYANIAASGGNLVVAVGGSAVQTVTSTGANITGYANVTGNVTSGNISAIGIISDANGLLRSLPINPQGGAYTLTANDNGNLISITSGNVTVPASVFASPFGQAVTVYNNSGTTRYITQGAGTTLRLAGTAATGNRTLAQYGLSTIVCVSANTFVVSGVGLS